MISHQIHSTHLFKSVIKRKKRYRENSEYRHLWGAEWDSLVSKFFFFWQLQKEVLKPSPTLISEEHAIPGLLSATGRQQSARGLRSVHSQAIF